MLGTVRTLLQAGWIPGIIALLPAIKGLWTDIKVPAGETGIVIMGIVIIKPFQSLPGFF